jgi:hypothetical protein
MSCELSPFSGSITITEEEPIIGVTVFGSACTPPGYVMIEAIPLRPEWIHGEPIIRMRRENLWGMHTRYDSVLAGVQTIGRDIMRPVDINEENWKDGSHPSHPLDGFSSAHFDLPACKSVIITGGSQVPPSSDKYPYDSHYMFHSVRITVTETKSTMPPTRPLRKLYGEAWWKAFHPDEVEDDGSKE